MINSLSKIKKNPYKSDKNMSLILEGQKNLNKIHIKEKEKLESKVINSEEEKKSLQSKNLNDKIIFLNKAFEIEANYRNGISAYKDTLFSYRGELINIEKKIKSKNKEKQHHHILLRDIETKIEYAYREFIELDHRFNESIKSIKELKYEYKNFMNKNQYTSLLINKRITLEEIGNEIERKEFLLLNKELNKIQILGKLEPIIKEVEELKFVLKDIGKRKEHFENNFNLDSHPSTNFLSQESNNTVIDTYLIESK